MCCNQNVVREACVRGIEEERMERCGGNRNCGCNRCGGNRCGCNRCGCNRCGGCMNCNRGCMGTFENNTQNRCFNEAVLVEEVFENNGRCGCGCGN